MKKITTILLLFLSLTSKGQQKDLLYVPQQNSLVASHNYKQIGLYFGGYFLTTIPQPYVYTTPLSIVNRVGLTYVNKNNTYSVMLGAFIKNYQFEVDAVPDMWVKVYPIRMITKNKNSFDFSLGVNYSDGFRYGIGLSFQQ
jgi:hypothetical protein